MVDIQFMHTSLPVISCTGIPPTKGHWFFFKLRSENVVWLVTQPRDDSAFLLGDIQNVPRICEEWNPGVHWDLYFGFDFLKHPVGRSGYTGQIYEQFFKETRKNVFPEFTSQRERDLFSVLKTYTLAAFLFCANLNVSLLSNKCKSFSSNTNRNQLASVNREPHTFHIFFLHENHWL